MSSAAGKQSDPTPEAGRGWAFGGSRSATSRPPNRGRGGWPWLALIAALLVVVLVLYSRSVGGHASRLSLPRKGGLALLPLVNAQGAASVDWVEHGLLRVVAETLEHTPGVDLTDAERLAAELRHRALAGSTEEGRQRQRQLALALGAEFVTRIEISRRAGGWLAEVTVLDSQGEVGRASLEGEDLVALADGLVALLAAAVGTDVEPPPVAGLFTASPFLLRLYAMGVEALAKGEPATAERHFETCLETTVFAAAQAGLARARGALGRSAESAELWAAVLLAGQQRGDSRRQAAALVGLAELAVAQGHLEQAAELQTQARGLLAGPAARRGLLALLHLQARLALTRGQSQQAEELFFERLQLEQQLGDLLGQADSLLQLGSLAQGRDLAAAADLFSESRQLAAGFEDRELEHRALASLGEVQRQRGDLQAAEQSWNQALAYRLRLGHRQHQRILLRQLADLAYQRGQLDRAEERWEDLLELAEQLGETADIGTASLRLTRTSLRRGYPFQARSHLERALALADWHGEPIESQRLIAWVAYEGGHYLLARDTQRAARRQAKDRWSAEDEAFLQVYELAGERNQRLALPGEPGYRPPASDE